MSEPCHVLPASCEDGAYYLGRPGNLNPIDGGFGGISRKWNDKTTIRYTAAGQPRAQVADTRPYLEWSFTVEDSLPEQYAAIHALITTDPGPFVPAEPYAPRTNLPPPAASPFRTPPN